MEPSETLNGHARIVSTKRYPSFPISKGRSSTQTRSLASPALSISSSSSTSSGNDSRIPFSWEQMPGVPKKQVSKKEGPSPSFLPLPPPTTPASSKSFSRVKMKNPSNKRLQMDPFLIALVECSKNDDEETIVGYAGPKIKRSLRDRFGFVNLYASCKSSGSVVSESIVPTSRRSIQGIASLDED